MTPRQRLLTALSNRQPDHVPAAPDLYEMIPIRLSDRPSWEIFVYGDPPPYKARMDACAYYGVDAFIPLYVPMPEDPATAIVFRSDEKLITRTFIESNGDRHWSAEATVYEPREPSAYVKAKKIGLPETHEDFEVVTPSASQVGKPYFDAARAYVGEQGVVAPMVFLPCLGSWEEEIYEYYDNPEGTAQRLQAAGEAMMASAERILSWDPDVLMIGNSGLMLFNPVPIFREHTLCWLQKLTNLAQSKGIPTHLHCCGPERHLVEIAANESDLTAIEPLEISPMGDCDLKEIKKAFGHRIALKGNLHTTHIMLRGTVSQVEDACKRAIHDAGEGGGFILSTGDQTPRDTPDDNIRIMQKVAETYGRY